MGHHGSHGTTAAAMVHCVLSIYVSFVRELYVKYTFPPNKIFIAREQFIPPVACCRLQKIFLGGSSRDFKNNPQNKVSREMSASCAQMLIICNKTSPPHSSSAVQ